MPEIGSNLGTRFSVCNQLGVVDNDIPTFGKPVDETYIAEFKDAVDALFGGQLLNMSIRRYRLKESEKRNLLVHFSSRYSTYNCAGQFYDIDNPV